MKYNLVFYFLLNLLIKNIKKYQKNKTPMVLCLTRPFKKSISFLIIILIMFMIYYFNKSQTNQQNTKTSQNNKFFPNKYRPSKFEKCISNFYPNKQLNNVLPSCNKTLLSEFVEYFQEYYKAIEEAELKTNFSLGNFIIWNCF